jgi:hypothetical protein
VVGEVLDLRAVHPDAAPLLYFGSRFRTLSDQGER